jgi:hypothetical protein
MSTLVQRMIQMVLLVVVLIEIIHAGYYVSAFQLLPLRPISYCSQSRPLHDRRDMARVSAKEASRSSSPLAIRPAWPLPRQKRGGGFKVFASSSTTMLEETMNRLGLQGEKFDRWRHLQKLLDDETDPVDTNRLVYGVLERYYNAKKIKSGDDEDDIDTAPERTTERLLAIGKIVQEYSSHQSLDVISSSSFGTEAKDSNDANMSNVSLQQALMEILPHPVNEEDDHKGTWDTVMELHGREGVRIEEQTPNNLAWKERCLAARILIYYDFLDYAAS